MIIIKARLPHSFFTYASNFSLVSMIMVISNLSYEIFLNPDKDMGRFAKKIKYTVDINKRVIKHTADVVQTWLIDMLYDIIVNCNYGTKSITVSEALHLIALYNDYSDDRDRFQFKKSDIWLRVYGFFGEQKKFQSSFFAENFSREKYILESISKKEHTKNTYNIDITKVFLEITNYSTDEYSSIFYVTTLIFLTSKGIVFSNNLPTDFANKIFSQDNIINILNQNSTTINEIRNSNLKRQLFYSKPIIKIENFYIATNPHLMQSLFVNSNYWIIRNEFNSRKSQKFINAFGIYFEMYVEEILEYCLKPNQFKHINETNNGKRADWIISIDKYNFIIEQKSTLSLLGIKQNQSDTESMKKYILKTWGEAVRQLNETQITLDISEPIKIILLYEDYYKSECLDELFSLDNELKNDYNYWLVNIREFEMLFMTYKNTPDKFFKIVSDKIKSEHEHSLEGRELEMFLNKNNVRENKYLKEVGIIEQYNNIKNIITNKT